MEDKSNPTFADKLELLLKNKNFKKLINEVTDENDELA